MPGLSLPSPCLIATYSWLQGTRGRGLETGSLPPWVGESPGVGLVQYSGRGDEVWFRLEGCPVGEEVVSGVPQCSVRCQWNMGYFDLKWDLTQMFNTHPSKVILLPLVMAHRVHKNLFGYSCIALSVCLLRSKYYICTWPI